MPKGKNSRKKDKESRRRSESETQNKIQGDTCLNVQESPQAAAEETPPNLITLFRNEELIELRRLLHTQELDTPTLLVGAVAIGKFDLVRRLLGEGYPVNCYGPGHMTPLMWAAQNMSLEMIDMLLTNSADVSLVNEEGDNALMIAVQDHKWDETSFIGFWNLVKDCENLDLNHANNAENTLIHYAINKQWIFFIKAVLPTKVNVDLATKRGVTPLIMAGLQNHFIMVKLLLRARADILREDEHGCTVLCYAFASVVKRGRHSSILQHLLDALESETHCGGTIRDYLQRRLYLLLHPPKDRAVFITTIANIITHVISSFIRCLVSGVELLLEVKVFAQITEATEHHLEDAKYCHALMGVMFELVRYCPCRLVNGQTDELGEQLRNAFVEEGGANACLNVLTKHCGAACNEASDIILVAALIPLLSACCETTCENKFCIWLEAHYNDLMPFYKAFTKMEVITINLNTELHHIKETNEKIKLFNNLMLTLEEKRVEETRREKSKVDIDDSIDLQFEELDEQEMCSKRAKRKAAKAKKLKLEQIRRKNLVQVKVVAFELKDTNTIGCTKDREPDVNIVNWSTEGGSGEFTVYPVNKQSINSNLKINWETEETKENNCCLNCSKQANELLSGEDTNPSCSDDSDFGSASCVHASGQNSIVSGVETDEKQQGLESEQSGGFNAPENCFQMLNDVIARNELNKSMETCSNPDQEKDLTGGTYIENMFADILAKFHEVWHWEKVNNFPGHVINMHASGVDITLQMLHAILPTMEHEHIEHLKARWRSLITKLRLTDKDTFHKYIGRLDVLLQCYLTDIEHVLYNEDTADKIFTKVVEQPMRKRRFELPSSLQYKNCKKARIDENAVASPYSPTWYDYGSHTIHHITTENKHQKGTSECCTLNYEAFNCNFPVLNNNNYKYKKGRVPTSNASTVGEHNFWAFGSCYQKTDTTHAVDTQGTGNAIPRLVRRDLRKTAFSSFKYREMRKKKAGKKIYNVKTIVPSSTSTSQIGNGFFSSSSIPTKHSKDFPPSQRFFSFDNERNPSVQADTGLNSLSNARPTTVRKTENDNVTRQVINVTKGNMGPAVQDGRIGSNNASNDKTIAVSVKHIFMDTLHMGDALKDLLNSLTKIRHTNIAHLIAYCQRGNKLLLGNANCAHNLRDYLQELISVGMIGERSKNLISQMATGLSFLHKLKNQVVHGNLKPTNILIDSKGIVKLADFGLASVLPKQGRLVQSVQLWWSVDTHINYSPDKPLHHTQKSDVQTLGMLVHYVETGGFHPYGCVRDNIVANVISGRLDLSFHLGHEIRHLVTSLLARDPDERPTILKALRHLYFWDVAKKWGFVLACAGIASATRHLPLSAMCDLHTYLDDKLMLKMDLWCWIPRVSRHFPMMEPISIHFNNSPSGLLKFIRACVDYSVKISFGFSLREFFLTNFATLPLILYQLIDNTEWLHHQVFYLNESLK